MRTLITEILEILLSISIEGDVIGHLTAIWFVIEGRFTPDTRADEVLEEEPEPDPTVVRWLRFHREDE